MFKFIIKKLYLLFKMKKYILTFFATMLFFNSFSQEKDNTKPKGKWRVSKEYDDQGNMISYDSVSVWSSDKKHDFEFFKNDSLPHHFKGFIRDFEMPNFHFREGENIRLGMRDFFEGFEFPEMNFQWFERDSLNTDKKIRGFFDRDEFDFQKQIDELRKQMEAIRKDFDEKHKAEAIEPKKMEEHKL